MTELLAGAFHWFYCLPLYRAFLVLAVAVFAYLWIRDRWGNRKWWKPLMLLGLAAALMLIYVQTIRGRGSTGVPLEPILTPFHTYRAYLQEPFEEILRMNFMNTVLVFPAGLLLCELLPKRWRFWRVLPVVLVLGALCAGVEYFQYINALGQAEIDDVIHNTLGALLGALTALCPFPRAALGKLWEAGKIFLRRILKSG